MYNDISDSSCPFFTIYRKTHFCSFSFFVCVPGPERYNMLFISDTGKVDIILFSVSGTFDLQPLRRIRGCRESKKDIYKYIRNKNHFSHILISPDDCCLEIIIARMLKEKRTQEQEGVSLKRNTVLAVNTTENA